MASTRVLILRAPGTNCDHETAYAFARAGARTELVHVNRILENPCLLTNFQVLCLPGGFSYGDDIAAGRILACQIRHHLADAVHDFREAGKLVLGICNGFQVLMKSGLLLDENPDSGPAATLTWNDSGKFEDRWVHLSVDGNQCVFLDQIRVIHLPVAHAEGKFVSRDADTLGSLDQSGQLVLRYSDTAGSWQGQIDFPLNPNGSMSNVAGVCDKTGHVLGMMPHPERFIDPMHHPRWTRRKNADVGDGLRLFQNAVDFFR